MTRPTIGVVVHQLHIGFWIGFDRIFSLAEARAQRHGAMQIHGERYVPNETVYVSNQHSELWYTSI